MPYTTLILTAGISSLSNRNVVGKILRKPNSPVHFPEGKQNPEARDSAKDSDSIICECLDFVSRHLQFEELDPSSISAEFSMFDCLRKDKKITDKALVYMIHTPTLGGRLAVELQKIIWEKENISIQAEELTIPFDPSQPGGLALSSGAFIGTVSRLLSGHSPHQTAFAPIGGYKVMVALGHIAASFHGFSSLYIHEDSQQLQELAPAPVKIDHDEKLIQLAQKIGSGAEESSLTEDELRTLNSNPIYFTRVNDLIELNELGQFLRLNETPILLSHQALRIISMNIPEIQTQLHQIRDKALQNIDYPGINHGLTGTKGRTQPWRLAQMGQGNRIAWQLHNQQLVIQHIWTDHDTYDKEAINTVTAPFPSDLTNYQRLNT